MDRADGADRSGPALLAAGGVAAGAYLLGLAVGPEWMRLAAKPVPVLCLAAWVIRGARGRFPHFVGAGLLLSALADGLIEASFLAGLATFLVAHLAYTAAFVADERRLRAARAIPFAAFGAGMFFFLRPSLGEMAVPVGVYVAAIGTMMWRAAARVGDSTAARSAWAALAGAILFAASDTLIALDRFHAPIGGVRYAIVLLYWAGQAGIASSAARPTQS